MPWYEEEPDAGNWDDRTSTLTFHTFRPKSPAELVPVLGVTHQMLNGTYDRRNSTKSDDNQQQINHNNNNINNDYYSVPKTSYKNNNNLLLANHQHSYYYQSPMDVNGTIDIFVDVQLNPYENRVGFSMSGGHEHLPTVINNVLEGSPADRAGLCAGDEILEINGFPMTDASYNEIIEHIRECIKTRNIQLKIRRKPENQTDSAVYFAQPSQNGTFTAEAYMVSVDANHKPELSEQLKKYHPGIKISDMERLAGDSSTALVHQQNHNHHNHCHKNGHAKNYTNGVCIDEEETSFVNGQTQPTQNHNNNNNNFNKPQQQHPISVGQYYGSKSSFTSNGSIVNNNNNGENNVNNNNNGNNFTTKQPQQSVENERLKRYEIDLKKRRQAEDKQAKEEEFLRSSLRGSKKLQALEQERKNSSACHENDGFEHENETEDDEDDDEFKKQQQFVDRPIVPLDDVLMSVNRLTQELDQMPEHRHESQFIRDLFSDKFVQNAIEVTAVSRAHFSQVDKLSPMSKTSFQDAENIVHQLDDSVSDKAGELQNILEKAHVKSVLYAHDKIAEKLPDVEPSTSFGGVSNGYAYCGGASKEIMGLKETPLDGGGGNLRIIKLIKDGDHPLGATVKNDAESIVIGRIVKGGVAEKCGLLKEGDEILDVNGMDVRGKSVHEVCDLLANLTGEITFVVVPAPPETIVDAPPHTIIKHVRALYNYEPEDDIYLPCRELGLHFGKGDILHVISMTDTNWWQALRDGEENVHQLAGLVPSASLQTQKEQYNREVKAEVDKENDEANGSGFLCTKRKKQKRQTLTSKKSKSLSPGLAATVDDDDIPTYEEVSLYLSPTGRRRPIVLVGPLHVGCLELRQKLMETEKDKFAGVVPHTSRPRRVDEQDGVHYYFVSRQQFQDDVGSRKFVEWGEYQKHFYGTSFESIKRVVDRGKTCVLTLKAQSLKALRNSDFMPFVVFVSPPSFERLKINKQRQGEKDLKEDELRQIIIEAKETEEKFGHLFDKVLVNFDLDRTFQELRLAIHRLETEPQWVPSGWLKNPNSSLSR